jgi:hypothetical protein
MRDALSVEPSHARLLSCHIAKSAALRAVSRAWLGSTGGVLHSFQRSAIALTDLKHARLISQLCN